MRHPHFPSPEPLEARIAPALTIVHNIPDLVAGIGKTGATLDLSDMFDAAASFRTHVEFVTNYIDPNNPGVPQVIDLEMFDDKAPVTVANFLRYVTGAAPSDYNGMFFHRSVPGFVLQGGGFDVAAPGTHIATDPDLHNEFTAGDPERSNLTGTVAMAKTGLGPHTATSEWFINLGNNSANLDNQNGGFTVFAKVTAGMNVVNAMAALPTYSFAGSLNSALTDVPLQNYNPDPDNDPATPPPTPTTTQFVTVTSASIIHPAAANAPGITYSVVSVLDATTLAASDLVAPTLNGQSLQLAYKAGASGVAKVTVKASKSGEVDVFDDFLVTVKPNIIATTTVETLPSLIVPGDHTSMSVRVANSGGGTLTGNFDVTFYLSKFTASDPQGTIVEPGTDTVLAKLTSQPLNLASGASTTVTADVTIPLSALLQQRKDYRVLADIQLSPGTSVSELFTDDNGAINAGKHRLFDAFGTFNAGSAGSRTNAPLSYIDAGGKTVTVTLTGAGFGQFDPAGTGAVGALQVSSTTAASALSVTTNDGTPTPLDSVFINAVIGTASLGNVRLNGDFTANAGIESLTLGDVGDGAATHTLTIGTFAADAAQKATITLGNVRDIALTSAMPLGSLTAVAWLDTNASHEVITAPALDSLTLTGDANRNGAFQPTLNITGPNKLPSFSLSYLDAANHTATLAITGGGYAQFNPQRGGASGPLALLDTVAASQFTITTATTTTLDSIDIAGPLDTITLPNVKLNGDFNAHGGIKSLTLGDVGDGTATHTLTIGTFAADAAQKAAITLGEVREIALTSAMPLGALTAVDWFDLNVSHELITAPAMDSLFISGNVDHAGAFQADLTLIGDAKLQTFIVTGAVSNSRVHIAGDVGKVKLGTLVGSDFLVGVTSVPAKLADFGATRHRIDIFKIKNGGPSGIPINDSHIAAAKFGSIVVSQVDGAGGSADWGFIADRIASYQVGAKLKANLDAPKLLDRHNHYVTQLV